MATRGIWRTLFVPRGPAEPTAGALFRNTVGFEPHYSPDGMFSHCCKMKSSA